MRAQTERGPCLPNITLVLVFSDCTQGGTTEVPAQSRAMMAACHAEAPLKGVCRVCSRLAYLPSPLISQLSHAGRPQESTQSVQAGKGPVPQKRASSPTQPSPELTGKHPSKLEMVVHPHSPGIRKLGQEEKPA